MKKTHYKILIKKYILQQQIKTISHNTKLRLFYAIYYFDVYFNYLFIIL